MKYITLECHETRDVDGKKQKVKIGEAPDFPLPEKMEEFQELIDSHTLSADEIVACFNYGWRVKRQAEMKRENKSPEEAANVKLFKRLTADQQKEILAQFGMK